MKNTIKIKYNTSLIDNIRVEPEDSEIIDEKIRVEDGFIYIDINMSPKNDSPEACCICSSDEVNNGIAIFCQKCRLKDDIDLTNLDLKNITDLTFDYGQDITDLDLKNVTHLTFGDYFNQDITELDLKNVTHLDFGMDFNRDISNLDLKNVTHLYLGMNFNQDITNLDLKNVTHLDFSTNFNQDMSNLDLKNVTHLTLDFYYWQDITNLDLKNVTHLTFGFSYNEDITCLDLKNVAHLTVDMEYFKFRCFNDVTSKLWNILDEIVIINDYIYFGISNVHNFSLYSEKYSPTIIIECGHYRIIIKNKYPIINKYKRVN